MAVSPLLSMVRKTFNVAPDSLDDLVDTETNPANFTSVDPRFPKEQELLFRIIGSTFKLDIDGYSTESVSDNFSKNGVILAGGAINSIFTCRPINDLDLYLRSVGDPSKKVDQDPSQRVEEYLRESGYSRKSVTNNAITYGRMINKVEKTIQIITRFGGSPEEIFNTFDFTIVQGAYDFRDNLFHFGESFFKDCAKRKLIYRSGSQYPLAALARAKKYQGRGYSISAAQLVNIGFSISRLKLNTYGDAYEQLIGVDPVALKKMREMASDDRPFDAEEFLTQWTEFDVDDIDLHLGS